jgi:Domain of unknown function (DUF4189)
MKALCRLLASWCVVIAALATSQTANADWIEEKIDSGCVSYKWHSFPKDNYAIKKNLYRYSWSGQCNSGEPISGKGILTTLIAGDPRWWLKEEGEFKQGIRVGSFLIRSSNYPAPLRTSHKNGCIASDADCSPKSIDVISAPTTNIEATSKTARYGALSIDLMQGSVYGWAVDETSKDKARDSSLAQCNRLASRQCAMVMEFGNTCASYAIDAARSSTAYGWAYAPTKPEADTAALQNCVQRGGGNSQCLVRVWGCTSNAAQAGKR